MENSHGLRNKELETTVGDKVFTWRAKTEEAWNNRENADHSNWKEWVCVGTREA
jgi:hypothetical protein